MRGSERIEQHAARWLARRDGEGWGVQDEAALESWLAESTAHRVAFVRLQSAWDMGDRLKALGAGIPAGTLPERGRWAGLATPMAREDASAATPRRTRPRLAAMFGLMLAACALALLGWQRYDAAETLTLATTVGELRSVVLADGSQVTLSSDSQLQVRLSRRARRVDLMRGEAFFEVARDADRPFSVLAGERHVVAVGTAFAVRRDPDELRVVVTEGVVRLESRADAQTDRPALLAAGSIAVASRDGVLVRHATLAEAQRHLDWREGFLHFRDTALADAAAEFNRYNTVRIEMGDPAVAALRVGGNFRWSNAEAFARLLEQGFPVRAEREGDRIVLHSR